MRVRRNCYINWVRNWYEVYEFNFTLHNFSDLTYGLLCESVATLHLVLSGPLFSPCPAFQLKSYRIVMAMDKANAARLSSRLFDLSSSQTVAPSNYISEEGGSLVLGIASGMWNILTLGEK